MIAFIFLLNRFEATAYALRVGKSHLYFPNNGLLKVYVVCIASIQECTKSGKVNRFTELLCSLSVDKNAITCLSVFVAYANVLVLTYTTANGNFKFSIISGTMDQFGKVPNNALSQVIRHNHQVFAYIVKEHSARPLCFLQRTTTKNNMLDKAQMFPRVANFANHSANM